MEQFTITAAEWVVNLLTVYAALGVLFAIAFVGTGIKKVDPVARDSGLGFRLIILPGVVALWPLLAVRWIRNTGAST